MRNGNFNSSEIVALLSMGSRDMTDEELAEHKRNFPKSRKKTVESWPGPAAKTFIEECNMERRLMRALMSDTNSRPTSWGHLCEKYVFTLLGLEYSTISKQTIIHPDYSFWVGTPDSICYGQENTVVDIKCPFTLKSFCQFVDSWERGGINAIRETHNDGEKYYQQIVSNACLTGCNCGELIIYVPYQSELIHIQSLAEFADGKTRWAFYTNDSELPWIPENGYYKNLNKFKFQIPSEDKKLLEDRVIEAGKLLVEPKLIAV